MSGNPTLAGLIAVALSLPGIPAAHAQQPSPGAVQVQGADLELIGEVRGVAGRLESVRGAKVPRLPLAVRATGAERESAASARALSMVPADRLAARGRAWQSLGLGTSATPSAVLRLLAEDLEGIGLDAEGRKLLVDPERLAASEIVEVRENGEPDGDDAAMSLIVATGVRPDEPVVAHFLIHALQDSRRAAATPGTTDALLADAAWREGEANLAALLYLFRGMGLHGEVVAGHVDPSHVLEGRLVPPALGGAPAVERSFLDFVYLEGFAQARERLATGTWRSLDEAAAARRTTRDVLHADRTPLAVRREGEAATLAGYAIADEDVLGEQGIVTLVATLTGKDNLALQAADGWEGDRLRRLEPASGGSDPGYTAWDSWWSSEERAKDFEYGIERALQARFPGKPLVETGPGRRVLTAAEVVYRIERAGTAVSIRVAPAALDAKLEAMQAPPAKARPAATPPNSKKDSKSI